MIDQIIVKYQEAIFDTDKSTALVVYNAAERGLPHRDSIIKVVVPSIEYISTSITQDFGAYPAQLLMAAKTTSETIEEMISLLEIPPQSNPKTFQTERKSCSEVLPVNALFIKELAT